MLPTDRQEFMWRTPPKPWCSWYHDITHQWSHDGGKKSRTCFILLLWKKAPLLYPQSRILGWWLFIRRLYLVVIACYKKNQKLCISLCFSLTGCRCGRQWYNLRDLWCLRPTLLHTRPRKAATWYLHKANTHTHRLEPKTGTSKESLFCLGSDSFTVQGKTSSNNIIPNLDKKH